MFDSPKVKRDLISVIINLEYEFPHELQNDLIRIFANLDEDKLLFPFSVSLISHAGFSSKNDT